MRSFRGSPHYYFEPRVSFEHHMHSAPGIIQDTFLGIWLAGATLFKSVAFTAILLCYAVMFLFVLQSLGYQLPIEFYDIVTILEFDLWVQLKEFEFQSEGWRVVALQWLLNLDHPLQINP